MPNRGGDGRDRGRHHRGQKLQRVRCVLQMDCLGASGRCRRVEHSLYDTAVVIVGRFTMESVGPTPRHATWAGALFLTMMELSSRLRAMRGAPVALYDCNGMETVHAWLECAETGLIGQSPTISVGTVGIYSWQRAREGPTI